VINIGGIVIFIIGVVFGWVLFDLSLTNYDKIYTNCELYLEVDGCLEPAGFGMTLEEAIVYAERKSYTMDTNKYLIIVTKYTDEIRIQGRGNSNGSMA
jgi:hypothetical protein